MRHGADGLMPSDCTPRRLRTAAILLPVTGRGVGQAQLGVSAPWDVKGKATGDVGCRPGRFRGLRTASPRVWSLGACGRQRQRVRRSPPVTSAVLCWPGLSHTCLFKGTMCKTISHSASGRGPERQGRQPRDTQRPERPGPGAPTPSEATGVVSGRASGGLSSGEHVSPTQGAAGGTGVGSGGPRRCKGAR